MNKSLSQTLTCWLGMIRCVYACVHICMGVHVNLPLLSNHKHLLYLPCMINYYNKVRDNNYAMISGIELLV